MKDISKKYSNGEVTIVWQPSLCIHSKICWDKINGLPEVFDPARRPWIIASAASTHKIVAQVNKCPSGALSYFMNDEETAPPGSETEHTVEVSPNGPLLIYGNISIKNVDGTETKKYKVTALCRCGASANKPYCDGTHQKINFIG